MTASAALAREIRVLPSLTGLPPGCLAHPVPDDTAEPHLHQGEFAVIDATDRAPAHGELFLVAYGDPTAWEARALRIVEGILAERERIKRQTLTDRRLRHHAQAA